MTQNADVDVIDSRMLEHDRTFNIFHAHAPELGSDFQVRDLLELHLYNTAGVDSRIRMELSEAMADFAPDGKHLGVLGWIYFPEGGAGSLCLVVWNS